MPRDYFAEPLLRWDPDINALRRTTDTWDRRSRPLVAPPSANATVLTHCLKRRPSRSMASFRSVYIKAIGLSSLGTAP
jgi:hypothetical protein